MHRNQHVQIIVLSPEEMENIQSLKTVFQEIHTQVHHANSIIGTMISCAVYDAAKVFSTDKIIPDEKYEISGEMLIKLMHFRDDGLACTSKARELVDNLQNFIWLKKEDSNGETKA